MKVKDSVGNYQQNEVYSEIDLFSGLPKLSDRAKDKIRKSVGDLLVEETLLSLDKTQSPVKGVSFAPLSESYKEKKEAEGGRGVADLELKGDLKDSFTYKESDVGIRLGHFDSQAPKADGHNNFSGNSTLPNRRYIPAEGQDYKDAIKNRAESIIASVVAEETSIKASELDGIQSKADLWSFLTSKYGDLSRPAIKTAVLNNESVVRALSNADLLRFL